nr:MAG TPA: hypothetical protein [Caudoviricetes sp.]
MIRVVFASITEHCAPLIRNVSPFLISPSRGRTSQLVPPLEYYNDSPFRLISASVRLDNSTKLCEQ